MTPEKKQGVKPGQFSLLSTAGAMGLHMVSGPVVGGALGYLADMWLGSWPVGSAIGLLLGVAAGFRNVFSDARYLAKKNAAQEAEERALRERQRLESQEPLPVKEKNARKVFAGDERSAEEPCAKEEGLFTASVLAGTAVPGDEEKLEDLEKLFDNLEESFNELQPAHKEEKARTLSNTWERHEHY